MPVVNLRVDDATRALWVEAAGGEQLTLSEWIRKACDARLGLADRYVDMPLRLDTEATRSVGETAEAATAPEGERGNAGPNITPPAPTDTPPPAETAQAAADALAKVAWPEREFRGPDLKPSSEKKKRR